MTSTDLASTDLAWQLRFPLMLDLRDKRVLAVGGGPISARRVSSLLDVGARVDLVAPWICEDLGELIAENPQVLHWLAREFEPADINWDPTDPIWLVHTATGDPQTDELVVELAGRHRIWSIRADQAQASPAWVPAVARDESGLTVAVSASADPGRARSVRDAVAAHLADGSLGVRRSRHRLEATRSESGRVALVGGGPGHPDLITVRGRRLLAQADVIVADRLGPTTLLAELEGVRSGEVTVIDVGKLPGNHPVPQERINQILVEYARRGSLVVRLKGGDPFVLGRGGEEALYCAAHGVTVEVVPGVSAAVAVPAAAGIPVTHRGITTSFVVASAHAGQAGVVAAHAAASDATLVLLMGVSALAQTAGELIAAGRSPQTPVAIIADGWLPTQDVATGTLGEFAESGTHPDFVGRPAVIVVGDVVGVREQLCSLGVIA